MITVLTTTIRYGISINIIHATKTISFRRAIHTRSLAFGTLKSISIHIIGIFTNLTLSMISFTSKAIWRTPKAVSRNTIKFKRNQASSSRTFTSNSTSNTTLITVLAHMSSIFIMVLRTFTFVILNKHFPYIITLLAYSCIFLTKFTITRTRIRARNNRSNIISSENTFTIPW